MTGLCFALALAAWGADASKPKANTETMQQAYDDAFKQYQAGDYRKAISKWNDILRSDPSQASAKQMIEKARRAIQDQIQARRAKLGGLINQGRYRDALLDIQSLLDLDPTDAQAQLLETRLQQLSELVPAVPENGGKAWRVAELGLKGMMSSPADLKLAHNGLRYAAELAPGEPVFEKLVTLFRSEFPQAWEDDVTPGMKLLEFKRLVALNHIYDARYHAAIATLHEVLQLEPDDLTALKQLGSAYFSLGLKAKAREAWLRAAAFAPKDPTLRDFLAKTAPAARR